MKLFYFSLNVVFIFKSPQIDSDRDIHWQLNDALLDIFDVLLEFQSSASLYWFFALFNQIIQQQTQVEQKRTYDKCLNVLLKFSKLYKYNPYYSILKMRFSYNCLPFELNLYDVDLYFKFDLNTKFAHTDHTALTPLAEPPHEYQHFGHSTTTTTTTTNPNENEYFPASEPNPSSTFKQTDYGLITNQLMTIKPSATGLLEVLPLSFKCIAMSQGTSIEKSNNAKQDFSLYMLPNYSNLFYNNQPPQPTAGFTITDPLMDSIPTLAKLTIASFFLSTLIRFSTPL
jgi:hypothetical protein